MIDFVVNNVKCKVKSYKLLYQKRFALEFFIFPFAVTMGPLILPQLPNTKQWVESPQSVILFFRRIYINSL